MELMVHRSKIVSLLVLVAIVAVAAGMYAAFGSQGGFVGVPRLLPSDFAQGAGGLLNTIIWGLLIAVMFVLLGVAVYYLRGLKD